jgi:hypothetical protein
MRASEPVGWLVGWVGGWVGGWCHGDWGTPPAAPAAAAAAAWRRQHRRAPSQALCPMFAPPSPPPSHTQGPLRGVGHARRQQRLGQRDAALPALRRAAAPGAWRLGGRCSACVRAAPVGLQRPATLAIGRLLPPRCRAPRVRAFTRPRAHQLTARRCACAPQDTHCHISHAARACVASAVRRTGERLQLPTRGLAAVSA